jgi:hypothetical protein
MPTWDVEGDILGDVLGDDGDDGDDGSLNIEEVRSCLSGLNGMSVTVMVMTFLLQTPRFLAGSRSNRRPL